MATTLTRRYRCVIWSLTLQLQFRPVNIASLKFCYLKLTREPGSETTTWLLTLAFYYLIAHPQTLQRLQTKLSEAYPNGISSIIEEKLVDIPFLDAVITETFRLGTPWFMPRVVPSDGVMLDHHFVPKDTIVVVATYSQQTNEENFSPQPLV